MYWKLILTWLTRFKNFFKTGIIYDFMESSHRQKDLVKNAKIKRIVTSKGFFSSAHRWYLKYAHPSKIKEDIQKKMVEISAFSKLLNYDIKYLETLDKSPVLEYEFVTEKFLNPAGKLRIIPVLAIDLMNIKCTTQLSINYLVMTKIFRIMLYALIISIRFSGSVCKV